VTVVPALNTPFPIEVTVFARLIEEIEALLSALVVTAVTPSGRTADPVQLVLPVTTLLMTVKVPLVPQANSSCAKARIGRVAYGVAA
jgi:hypothetical protein